MYASPVQVLNLSPFKIAPHLEPPSRGRFDSPSEWRRFYVEALSSIGATDIEYIGNTDCVPFTSVMRSRAREKVLGKLASLEDCTDIDTLIALGGGIAFIADESHDPVLTPQCCSDLSNMRDWASAVENGGNGTWQSIWNGHPIVFMRVRAVALHVSALKSEAGPPPGDDEAPAFSVRRAAFIDFLADADRERRDALGVVSDVVARLAPTVDRNAVARLLLSSPTGIP